jgi:hypothetical protein
MSIEIYYTFFCKYIHFYGGCVFFLYLFLFCPPFFIYIVHIIYIWDIPLSLNNDALPVHNGFVIISDLLQWIPLTLIRVRYTFI